MTIYLIILLFILLAASSVHFLLRTKDLQKACEILKEHIAMNEAHIEEGRINLLDKIEENKTNIEYHHTEYEQLLHMFARCEMFLISYIELPKLEAELEHENWPASYVYNLEYPIHEFYIGQKINMTNHSYEIKDIKDDKMFVEKV